MTEEIRTSTTKGYWIKSLNELLLENQNIPVPVIDSGILNRGSMLLIHGAAKIGKSMLINDLIVSLAQGDNWIGFSIPKSVRVLYLQAELPGYELINRFDKMTTMSDREMIKSNVFCSDMRALDLTNPKNQVEIVEFVNNNQVEVIVVDPLILYHTATDENSNTEMIKVMKAFRELNTKCRTSMVIIHHDGKSPLNNGGNAARGASSIFSSVDTDIHLKRSGNKSKKLKLQFSCRYSAPIEDRIIQQHEETLRFYHGENTKNHAIEVAFKGKQQIPRRQLAVILKQELGKGTSTVYNIIKDAIRSGFLIEVEGGLKIKR